MNYKGLFENTIKIKPEELKYCFITDNRRIAEKLISKRYFPVFINKDAFTLEDFIDTFSITVGRGVHISWIIIMCC